MRPVQTFVLAATLAGVAVPVLAQGGPPGGGGGFNRGAFMKFREQHKYTFQLMTTTSRGLMECERTPQTRIKPDQAKKILGVLNPLKKKPKLSQDEAKGAIKKLQVIFDGKQLSAVDKAIQASQRRMGGGPGGGGPGGPGGGPGGPGGGPGGPGGGPGGPGGGPGGPGGGRPGGGPGGPGGAGGFDPAKAKDFNPYNPQPGSPRYEARLESNKKLFAFLDARAAGKDAKLDLPMPGRPGGPGGPGGGPGGPGGPGRAPGNPR